MTACIH